MDIEALKAFLLKASLLHAFGTSNARAVQDGSTTITFEQDDWSFHDNFFGGEPYGGRAIIHYKQKPVWIMVYYGKIHSTSLAADIIHNFLRLVLQHPPQDKPLRGPDSFIKGNFEYRNEVRGTMSNYSGKELILNGSKEIYWATYSGGLVDQQAGVGF